MTLQTANETWDETTPELIREVFEQTMAGSNTLIMLYDDTHFVQTSLIEGGFFLEYGDDTGMYAATNERLPRDTTERIFLSFLDNTDTQWKGMTSYVRTGNSQFQTDLPEEDQSGPASSGTGSGGLRSPASGARQDLFGNPYGRRRRGRGYGSPQQMLRRGMEREISYGVSRIVMRLIRSLFRGGRR
ncbi:hypothetical protein AU468_13830 [Alkalispirochaeta sphaeroplastigenens]|uniref:Uncharacterized protein n=1 Tax=Alkalispirochaeta sphaeroplastigenens TaxID=1187066 RepID=A0A2S4JFI0_9SPIO|nr:hypothetical protein [Alkalispirochaeta sphaeroplastigenens]POQ98291.1 hypothetical protein AU468_13830 [Alkalispirochaeta sphaeroplastigenens]